jgi:hypothetical protein
MRTLADLLRTEAEALEKRAGGIAYLSYPYPCCIEEAAITAKKFEYPPEDRLTIDRRERRTTKIYLKPMKGSRKRKPLEIRIWV